LLTLAGAAVLVKLLATVLDVLNSVPGLAGLFQLVGIGYATWFGGRYLYKGENRRQLWDNVQGLWRQVRGGEVPEPNPESNIESITEPADAAMSGTGEAAEPPDQRQMFAGVYGTMQVLIPLTGLVDVAALRAKLEKDLGKVEAEIKSLTGRLSNSGFVDKAPAEVVQGARDALTEAQTQSQLLQERLGML
jgi:valyl-tRNA synthetase